MTEAYENLANAIVLQAVTDYSDLYNNMGTVTVYGKRFNKKSEMTKIEKFFKSDYCQVLSNMDGDTLIGYAKQRAKMDKQKYAEAAKKKRKLNT